MNDFWTRHKAVLLILLWQVANNLMYYIILEPSYVISIAGGFIASIILTIKATVSILSPIAGYIADIKYGQYKVLKFSTQFMLAFEFFILTVWILLTSIANTTDYRFSMLVSFLSISMIGYSVSRVFFIMNIIQFGIEQLRDEPTSKSDCYLIMVLFVEQLTELVIKICKSSFISMLAIHKNTVFIPNGSIIAFSVGFSVSVIFSVIILIVVEKYSSIFQHHNAKGNPYKLVYGVISFAIKHKKPIRRSAFTYCDDERPSRLDFGKQRYGGPFTTEQVEDVKVMINIIKVLIALSPYFLLELAGITILSQHTLRKGVIRSSNIFQRSILNNFILSPLIASIFILLYLTVIKQCVQYRQTILKRMGASLIIVIFSHLIMIASDIISRNQPYSLKSTCLIVNISSIDNINVALPELLLPTLLQVCLAFSQMLFYIAVWQFISCQSPRYMKRLLFGLYYFTKAVFQLFSIVVLYSSMVNWRRVNFGCPFDYLILYLIIGLITLLMFMITCHRYQYRKREDICNVYQYAEDYYTKL